MPDGGGYMMPDGDRFHMVNGANWFDRTVSADAAGIILTSLVINRQLWLYHDSGDAGLATVNKKPFTFILETERGLNLSIQAVPREGAGRTIQLVSDLRGTGEEAGAWETSTPYESLLVTISQAVRGGKLPAGWYQVPVTKETLQPPAGLSSVADAVWTGNHLKMIRFAVENKTLSALNIRESDFWQPGTRAVMFSQPAGQLLAGARMDVYVIRDGEGN
ncbi:type-F conjugative transfer system secretin TraK [Escherichia coli]|nr:type-F conjugative transfer system secretin TraK [Escherichia coli]